MKQPQNVCCHSFFKVSLSSFYNTEKNHFRFAHSTLANEICPLEKLSDQQQKILIQIIVINRCLNSSFVYHSP